MIFASEDEMPIGIRFEGSEARVHVNRGRIDGRARLVSTGPAEQIAGRIPRGRPPRRNARSPAELSRLRAQPQDPAATVEIGHRTNTVCYLSDIATRLKRKLRWDPEQEQFIGDDEANRMLSRPMRAPWQL